MALQGFPHCQCRLLINWKGIYALEESRNNKKKGLRGGLFRFLICEQLAFLEVHNLGWLSYIRLAFFSFPQHFWWRSCVKCPLDGNLLPKLFPSTNLKGFKERRGGTQQNIISCLRRKSHNLSNLPCLQAHSPNYNIKK